MEQPIDEKIAYEFQKYEIISTEKSEQIYWDTFGERSTCKVMKDQGIFHNSS